MKHKPLVTIIIPVYNAGIYLLSSVESIINQTYSNLQIIIVNDGSTDNCIDSIKHIVDSRITVLNQENSGKSVAMNNALKIAQGEFYAIQDADDISDPLRIEILVDEINSSPHCAAIFSGYDLIIDKFKRFAPINIERDEKVCDEYNEQYRMPSHDPTGFYRMSLVNGIFYDPDLRIGQGYDYILKVGEKYPMRVIEKSLYSYRIFLKSTTRKNSEIRKKMISLAWEKACERRNISFSDSPLFNQKRNIFQIEEQEQHGIVPHCMESVISLKRGRKFIEAFKVGIICISLMPLELYYFKPIIYCIIPLKVISFYRNLKKKLSDKQVDSRFIKIL